jgi:GNAT superfamily N-acetyltransferase
MADFLVPLYSLPTDLALPDGVNVRPAMAYEKEEVLDWIRTNFNHRWSSEASMAFEGHPIRCILAVAEGKLVGFACHDCTFRGFFGPMGVAQAGRGKGLGSHLLLAGLSAMRASGYAYGIIGDVDSAREFYEKKVGARVIENSEPGGYHYDLENPSTSKIE